MLAAEQQQQSQQTQPQQLEAGTFYVQHLGCARRHSTGGSVLSLDCFSDEQLVRRVCHYLRSITLRDDDAAAAAAPPSVFDGVSSASLELFIGTALQLVDYLRIDRSVLLFCVSYCGAAAVKLPLVAGNLFRVFLASLLVATKYVQDTGLSVKTFAALIGMATSDLRNLERALLQLLSFELYVSLEELHLTFDALQA